MDFLTLASKRCSVRRFDGRPVEQHKIDMILKAGHLAPTACNNQPQKVLVLKSEQALGALRTCTPCHFDAPLAFIICCDKRLCWQRSTDGKLSSDVDASIVTTHMMLQAADLGLGSTWVMYFDAAAVSAAFALPEDIEPIAVLPVGYPAPDYTPAAMHSAFRPEEELVEYF